MPSIAIIGAGFTGLSAAHSLSKAGFDVTIIEQDSAVGGLAGTFEVTPGARLEKFYHHWFTSDHAILGLIAELGLSDRLLRVNTNTALYYANSVFRLASPLDLLKFPAIPLLDRIRTGLMALYARRIERWAELEDYSAQEWLIRIGGREAYDKIWDPLLRGKFGLEAPNVSAVWIWNKLKLRGSSRGKGAKEELVYIRGGFETLAATLVKKLEQRKVRFLLSTSVERILTRDEIVSGVQLSGGRELDFDAVLATIPLPRFLAIAPAELDSSIVTRAGKIKFLANVCLVMRLSQSLSETYWLNVADPNFPFVGVIEHTNLDSSSNYSGEHIVYLSKYLPESDPLFSMPTERLIEYSIPYIQKMFPDFNPQTILGSFSWRARYSQPIICKRYSELIPPHQLPIRGLWLATMAQVYPQDRGTNYAVAHGETVAKQLIDSARST